MLIMVGNPWRDRRDAGSGRSLMADVNVTMTPLTARPPGPTKVTVRWRVAGP
jgi:hypothetical protein